MMRKTLAALLAAASTLASPLAAAEAYPTQSLRLLVDGTPGSVAERIARNVALQVSQSVFQPVVIELRPGMDALCALAQHPADGHTLALAAAPRSAESRCMPRRNVLRAVQPVAALAGGNAAGEAPLVWLVAARTPARVAERLHRELAAAHAAPAVERILGEAQLTRIAVLRDELHELFIAQRAPSPREAFAPLVQAN